MKGHTKKWCPKNPEKKENKTETSSSPKQDLENKFQRNY
jgi:hypothetical protein